MGVVNVDALLEKLENNKKMETVFKVEMEVYDQVFFPNKKGVIKRIYKDEPEIDFPIEVDFEGKIESYNLKGSCSYLGAITLSTKPYTLQGFEQKAPTPTFEKVWRETKRNYKPESKYYTNEFGGYPSQDLANAAEALRKLLFLRDYYNEGWQPNFKNKETKYTIYTWSDLFIDGRTFDYNRILCFKTEEIRDKFLEEQKELLEIAKPLL